MREMGLFDPREGNPTPETREEIKRLNEALWKARFRCLNGVLITLDMPERLILEILEARLVSLGDDKAREYCEVIHEHGGPSPRALRKYLKDVLVRGYGLPVDSRIRHVMATLDGGGEPRGRVPRWPDLFNAGDLTPAALKRHQSAAAEQQAKEFAEAARKAEAECAAEEDRMLAEAARRADAAYVPTEEELYCYELGRRQDEAEQDMFPEAFP